VPATPVPFQDETAQNGSLTLEWQLPLLTMTYVGDIRRDSLKGWDVLAVQGPIVNSFGGICATVTDPTCFTSPYLSQDHQSSDELRFSHESDSLRWVLGLYYYRERDTSFAGVDPCPCGNFSVMEWLPYIGEDSHAAFGQATWNATQALRFTGGIRYNDDFKGALGEDLAGAHGSLVPFQCIGCGVGGGEYASVHFHKVTWKVGADYDLTPDSLLFASVGTGYRDGGYNQGVQPNNSPFLSEDVINYELGWKNELLEHRLQVNVDAFHALYSNYQSTAGEQVGNTINLVTVNAAKAEIDGVELETVLLPTPQDRLALNASLLHAYFSQFPLPHGDGFNAFAPEDLSGRSLPYAPHATLHLSYSHTFPLANGGSLVPRVDASYTSSQYEEYHNFPVSYQGAYTRTDASVTYNAPSLWSLQFWAHNLENKAVLMNLNVDQGVPLALEGQYAKDGFYLPPRTYGAKVWVRL